MMAGIRLSNEEQKRLIMDCLRDGPMTAQALAERLLFSADTIRKRLKELQEETRMVRVVGWDMNRAALVRIWGLGRKRQGTPKRSPPSRRVRKAMQKKRAAGEEGIVRERAVQEEAVPYRLEPLDKWLFAIRRASW